MPIYGTALLSLCLLTGLTVGRMLGAALVVDADIGGVGICFVLVAVLAKSGSKEEKGS